MDVVKSLERIVGYDNVIVSKKGRELYSYDKSTVEGETPIAVVKPRNTKDVSRVLKFCNDHKILVTAHGGGSSLTGSSVPEGKSIVLDMSEFDKILEISIEDRYAVVESDVVLDDLNKKLAKYGFFYPPEPASSAFATVGGTISTNAGGLRAVKYGSTKHWVLGLEAVLPSGKIIQTGGRVLKRSIGYDLTGLMVASEGTLGVVTKATLAIWPKPEARAMVAAYFSNIEDTGRAVERLKKKLTPMVAEFMDRECMEMMEERRGIRFPKQANYMIFIELGSSKEAISRLVLETQRIMESSNALKIASANSDKRIEALYKARKMLFDASKEKAEKIGREIILSDVVVPASQLPDSLMQMKKLINKVGLEVVMFGHIGDGNIHSNIFYKVGDRKDSKKVDTLQEGFCRIAIKHNGSISGEHGIGLVKKKLLKEEFEYRHSVENIALMKKIKQAFDPNGILNKGKIFD